MEFVEGVNLSRLVKTGGPLPMREACGLIRQAAAGLQAAHAAGLIHRDVKPSNLIRATDGTVKVLDLGLARLAEDADAPAAGSAESVCSPGASDVTSASRVIGTVRYMAPEQKHDAHAVDARADVYGLGATLWFLLNGSPPGGSFGAPPGGLPAAVWVKLLAENPADRYPSAAAVADALAPFAAPARRRLDRRGRLTVAAAGVAVMIALVALLRPWQASGGVPNPSADPPPAAGAQPGRLPMTADDAKALQAAWAVQVGRPATVKNTEGMTFSLIPPGEFGLSSQCRVRLTRPFYLGTCEVTHGQFSRFTAESRYTTTPQASGKGGFRVIPDFKPHGGQRQILSRPNWVWITPGHEDVTDDHPVCQVSWLDAEAFCRWLSEKEKVAYRLPTEAELAWATRCGNVSDEPIAPAQAEAKAIGWHWYNAKQPQPVGRLRANAWGLYDTLGNVAEWVRDRAAVLPAGTFDDYAGPPEKVTERRVFFGYSYLTPAFKYQFRDNADPAFGYAHVGFRVVREIK
jgi:formylglycine-generating enzyme required for sulfatase activity